MLSYIKSGVAEGAKLQTGGLLDQLMFSFMLLTPSIKRFGDCGYSIVGSTKKPTLIVMMMMMMMIMVKMMIHH